MNAGDEAVYGYGPASWRKQERMIFKVKVSQKETQRGFARLVVW